MADDRVIGLDTSVIVTALHGALEQHAVAAPFLQQVLQLKVRAVVPLPALIESWSVLTRLPARIRLSPADAHELLVRALRGHARVIALDEAEGWDLVDRAASLGAVGGATYDLHIASCAVKAGATDLATFNPGHFERFGLPGLRILVPMAAAR